jgi:hypothetical protein
MVNAAIGFGLGGEMIKIFLSFSRRDAKKVVHYLLNSLSGRAPIRYIEVSTERATMGRGVITPLDCVCIVGRPAIEIRIIELGWLSGGY